jgi:hypothetical protein
MIIKKLKRIKQFSQLFLNYKKLKRTTALALENAYLNEVGYIKSIEKGTPYSKYGEPIPWLTYSFIYFIQDRLKPEMSILEFGSGNSTLYWSKRLKKVESIEHDLTWFEKFTSKDLPQNVNITLKKIQNDEYTIFSKSSKNVKFSVILIDGIKRVKCIKNNYKLLEDNGVMVLDDSERDYYLPGMDFLISKGFKKIDFWGLAPGVLNHKCTSIFYKENNCLGL